MSRGCMLYTKKMALGSYIYVTGLVLMPDIYMEQIKVLTRAGIDGPGIGDCDENNTCANRVGVSDVAISKGPVREGGVRARDF